ncbi:MAG TPA: hypothetical protein VGQ25_08510 [Gemmatimonadales bacterium]|nr:hypothetical protein [Gemmatimonadales bacterium]
MARGRMRLYRAEILLVWGLVGPAAPAAAAQQLGESFSLEERQGALARVPDGKIIRLRLSDGSRAAGPIRRWNAFSVTVGPYLGYAERDTFVALAVIDSLWLRSDATRRGVAIGGVAGGALGAVVGFTAGSLCPTAGNDGVCAQGAVTSIVAGLAIGSLAGMLVGSGTPEWRRLHPQGGRPTPRTGPEITLVAPGDSTLPDPRTVALARTEPGRLVRLQFRDRPDLAGYVVRAGARRATVVAVVGAAEEGTVPLGSLESIWERGTARRPGSAIGTVVGFAAGVFAASSTSACDPSSDCLSAQVADGLLGGLAGWALGGRVGSLFPKWQRRY